ncbi:MAG: response regulator transcription factor [Clostridiales bacterium]|nr:response regulator transcription factor [Clostridiales bacterium]
MDRILIVEDERPIAEILEFNLRKEGYDVAVVYRGDEALEAYRRLNPRLIVLDLMLPGMSGWDVCRQIRRESNVPILILTARDGAESKVEGLELGADDYVTKPFDMRELLARIRAILRRFPGQDGLLRLGDLEMDLENFTVRKRGQEIPLTLREFELLRHLLLHRGQVFTREELLRDVWDYQFPGDVRTVDVAIRRLREKIEDDSANPRYVLTKRGFGYYAPGP